MALIDAVELLNGVGVLYVAPADEAMPDVDATPSGNWSEMGETEGGVTVTPAQEIRKRSTDQRTGPVKAIRDEESLTIETNLVQITLENLAQVMGGQTVTDTAPGASTIGTREMGMTRGATVNEYALLFRGERQSPYGASYPAQLWIPRGYFDGENGMEFTKDGDVLIPVTFEALEDLGAESEAVRFGKFIAQDAAATG